MLRPGDHVLSSRALYGGSTTQLKHMLGKLSIELTFVDPDDLAAHYNLMRCLRRLHRLPEARHEEVIYQTLREDDGAKQIGLEITRELNT